MSEGGHQVAHKVVLVANTAWYIQNFRRTLIRRLRDEGYAVTAIAPTDEYVPEVQALGADFRALAMDNKGTNPLVDLRLAFALRRLLRAERPACVLTFTVKPNVFGTFAAASLSIPAICNVSGLGTAFIKRTWVTRVVKALYRAALRRAAVAFFQNRDDLDLFIREGIAKEAKARLLPGSGVDLERFSPAHAVPRRGGRFRFLLLGRLLWDKGIGEFVEAAERLRARHHDCEFALMGFAETDNRTAIPIAKIAEWGRGGLLQYVSAAADVRPQLALADCVVLPSYREGTPKSLLEAASMAKPVIAADVPGCRQVVEDGVTGFLARVRDAGDLAEKMERMVRLPESERAAMGMRGRQKMEREFDERIVVDEYLRAIREFEIN